MLKQLFFWAALIWASIIAFFCLVQLNNVPLGNVSNLDKFVHGFFHFVLTLLCFLYLRCRASTFVGVKPVIVSFLFSVFFGIGIEIAQELLTTTRHAEVLDVLGNISGATLAVAFIFLFGLNTKKDKFL